jgi:O-antigen/teichoic acid export membrane protein
VTDRIDGTDGASQLAFRAAVLKTFAGQIGFSILALAGSLLTARLLGASGRGALAILILVPSLFVTALEFGQESTASHLASRSPFTRGAIHANAALYGALLIIPGAVLVGFLLWPFHVVSGSLLVPAIGGGIMIGAGVYLRSMSGVALGSDRVFLYNASRLLLAGSFPLAVGILAIMGIRSPRAFFYASCCGSVAVAILLGLSFRRTFERPRRDVALDQVRIGLPIHVTNVAQFLLLRGDQLILAALATRAAVGRYSVAVNIAEALWYLPAAAGLVSIPFLSGDRSPAEKLAALRHALRVSLWLPAAGALVAAALAPVLIPIVFGEDFAKATWPLELLLPGIVAAGVVRVCSAALIARSQTSAMWKLTGLALIVNLVLNVILIPLFGASGAAVASSVAYTMLGLMLLHRTGVVWTLTPGDYLRLPLRRAAVLTPLKSLLP